MPNSISLPASADPTVYKPAIVWWIKAVKQFGRLPSRADLEPHDLGAKALPHVILVDIIDNATDLRFRLMGTNHVDFNRCDLSGKLFSAVYPSHSPVLAYLKELYGELITTRRPLWTLNEFVPPGKQFPIRMGRLMLPLSSDGETVNLCAAVQKIETPQQTAPLDNPWHQTKYTGEIERAAL
jgi:hypothetical protein